MTTGRRKSERSTRGKIFSLRRPPARQCELSTRRSRNKGITKGSGSHHGGGDQHQRGKRDDLSLHHFRRRDCCCSSGHTVLRPHDRGVSWLVRRSLPRHSPSRVAPDWLAPSLKNGGETKCRISYLSGLMSIRRRFQWRLHKAIEAATCGTGARSRTALIISVSFLTSLGVVGVRFISAMRLVHAVTDYTGNSPNLATTAWSSRPRSFP